MIARSTRGSLRLAAVAATLVVAVAGTLTGTGTAMAAGTGADPAAAPAYRYAALGDSGASGNGTGQYIGGNADGCYRSEFAYPSLLATKYSIPLVFGACAGASMWSVAQLQLPHVPADTGYVSLEVGANDAQLGNAVNYCSYSTPQACEQALATSTGLIQGEIPGWYRQLLTMIRQRAPQARVVIVGYPRMFSGATCADQRLPAAMQARLNTLTDKLDEAMKQAAAATGVGYVETRTIFAGHELCSADPWILPGNVQPWEALHPNRAGHRLGLAPAVEAALSSPSAAPRRTMSARMGAGRDSATVQRVPALTQLPASTR